MLPIEDWTVYKELKVLVCIQKEAMKHGVFIHNTHRICLYEAFYSIFLPSRDTQLESPIAGC